jgi:hypothetical protein
VNLLIDRCEEACAAVLTAPVGALAAVATGKSYNDKTLPIVICAADGAGVEEDPKGTGNFWINLSVQIKTLAIQNADGQSPADNPKTTSQALVSAVMAALMVDNLPALLSAAVADFTVFPNGVIFESPSSGKDEQGAWIDELKMRVYCCASTLAA